MSLTHLLVPTFSNQLKSLAQWLEKASLHAREHGKDANALLALKLAPDMYPLAAQVRFAAFQALEPCYRLRGLAIPEGWMERRRQAWAAHEHPGSLEQAQACLRDALAELAALEPAALDGRMDAPIALELPNGMVFDMSAEQYARDWALPQFYFHAITAYAILRHHGVALGKADYVAHMFAYLRPGTVPQG